MIALDPLEPRMLRVGADLLVESKIEAIDPVVEKSLQLLRNCPCAEEHELAVETALREALANAIVHGNHCQSSKKVRVRCGCDPSSGIRIVVQDEGGGFDLAKVPSPLLGGNVLSEHGRGIFLIQQFMDEVHFEDGGREIHMRKGGSTWK